MSLGSVLSVARTALSAHQVAIETAGHNIANAQTEGYSRQRVELTPNWQQTWSYGQVGTGVVVSDIRRARDVLLDDGVRRENGGEAATATRRELLTAVERVFGEPSDAGVANAMDALWSSWSDLATNPTSRAAKSVVLQRAGAAADTMNALDARLDALRTETTRRLDNTLTAVNGLAGRIAQLNAQIVGVEAGGPHQANDLRDQRDLAVDELARYGDLQVAERPDGSLQVLFGTHTLVDRIHARQLVRTTDPLGRAALAMSDAPSRALQPLGGSTQAMADFLNADLRGAQDQLDALANGLARAVNAVHGAGHDAAGVGGRPLDLFVDRTSPNNAFDPAASAYRTPLAAGAVTARTIGVHTALRERPERLATTSGADRPTDNDVALAVAGLRTSATVTVAGADYRATFRLPNRGALPTVVPGPGGYAEPPALPDTPATTFADYYQGAVGALAVRVQEAGSAADVRATLAAQARGRRDEVTGVNMDEELTALMRAQQAYAAAAKVVTAADEMMRTLVDMV
jgi:flagellar hook-associated protein 1 FlgK